MSRGAVALLRGFLTFAPAAGAGPEPVKLSERAPGFAGIEAWVNSKPLDWKSLKGKVVVVHFWTFG